MVNPAEDRRGGADDSDEDAVRKLSSYEDFAERRLETVRRKLAPGTRHVPERRACAKLHAEAVDRRFWSPETQATQTCHGNAAKACCRQPGRARCACTCQNHAAACSVFRGPARSAEPSNLEKAGNHVAPCEWHMQTPAAFNTQSYACGVVLGEYIISCKEVHSAVRVSDSTTTWYCGHFQTMLSTAVWMQIAALEETALCHVVRLPPSSDCLSNRASRWSASSELPRRRKHVEKKPRRHSFGAKAVEGS